MTTRPARFTRLSPAVLAMALVVAAAVAGDARPRHFSRADDSAARSSGTVVLQNDSGAGQIACVCFIPGEEVASWLTSSCTGELTNVQIGWGSLFGGQPDSLEAEIHIYRSGVFPDPGVEITAGELTGPVLVDGVINDFDVTSLGIGVCAGETIIVSLELFNQSSPPLGAAPVHDGDGCQLGKNTVFTIPGDWADACLLGVTGDWVIRAVVNCGSAPCAADANCDQTVDIVDLLGLLAAWGTNDPTYDLAPSGGDGTVDIQDLLALLSQWGPCG